MQVAYAKAAISTIGDWKKDVFICNNQEELEEAYKHIRSSRVMLQKYIHKKNELALEAVSANKYRMKELRNIGSLQLLAV